MVSRGHRGGGVLKEGLRAASSSASGSGGALLFPSVVRGGAPAQIGRSN